MPKANLSQSGAHNPLPPTATKRQQDYLLILLNDCGFGTRLERLSWLSFEVCREIRYIDQLTVGEASRLIGKLEERRSDDGSRQAQMAD